MFFKKTHVYITYIFFLSVIFVLFYPSVSFAAYPKLISTIINAFESIKTWIIRIATPAAAVAVRHRGVYAKIQFPGWRKH